MIVTAAKTAVAAGRGMTLVVAAIAAGAVAAAEGAALLSKEIHCRI